MTMRLRIRILLLFELLLGVLPLSFFYVYYFPVGIFWTRKVLELATRGIGNLYTSGIAVAFVVGGIGLLSLWVAILGRLLGRTLPTRFLLTGLSLAIVLGIAVLIFLPFYEAFWLDYYLYGAPLLVAVHQAISYARSSRQRLQHATT